MLATADRRGWTRLAGAGLAALTLGLASSFWSPLAATQSQLVLTPDSVVISGSVTGTQSVDAGSCPTYRLRWASSGGTLLGDDSGSDGQGEVTFRPPDGARPGSYQVFATCQEQGGSEQTVGQADFRILPANATTSTTTGSGTTTTSTLGRPTTTRGSASTTTTRPGSTSAPTTAPPGSTSIPGTTLPPAPADIAECERQAQEAQARLVYQPERKMTVGIPYDVVASVALSPDDVGSVTIPGPDPTVVVPLPSTRCTIAARLSGPDFEIDPSEPRIQSFIGSRVLTWEWQVRPTRAGSGLKLLLHLQPQVNEEGKPPRPGPEKTEHALIDVEAEEASLVDRTAKPISGFFGNPLVQFLVPGGGVVTLWAWRKLHKKPEAEPEG